jgi:hypothetical protein
VLQLIARRALCCALCCVLCCAPLLLSPSAPVQSKIQVVVSTAMKLLLLMYYEVLEDTCRMLAELVKVRHALLQPFLTPLADCLLDVYSALPVDRQPNLMKHVERALDLLALHLDVHMLMQVRPPRPAASSLRPLCTLSHAERGTCTR